MSVGLAVRREGEPRIRQSERERAVEAAGMKQVVVAVVASLLHRLIREGWDEPVRILEVDLDQGKADRRYLARR